MINEHENTESINQVDKIIMHEFKIGDFVYYSENEIGELTSVTKTEKGINYRVDYCQDKDLASGPRGGNGPIWRKGYPKEITKPEDVLFVAAMKEKRKIETLQKELRIAQENFSVLKQARDLLDA